jgi:hypothetical protein
VAAQYFPDFVGRPHEELALFAFTVGVLCRIETARPIEHFPRDIVQDFLNDGAVGLVARCLPGMKVDVDQLHVGIKHAL